VAEAQRILMLRHVVMFSWKPETPADKIREIEAAFSGLPAGISEVVGFEWGTDVSVQGLDAGFTHCFVVSLASEEDRDTYSSHPAHLEFIALSRPHVENLLVIDYHPQDAAGTQIE
jgi:hypothetical protein